MLYIINFTHNSRVTTGSDLQTCKKEKEKRNYNTTPRIKKVH